MVGYGSSDTSQSLDTRQLAGLYGNEPDLFASGRRIGQNIEGQVNTGLQSQYDPQLWNAIIGNQQGLTNPQQNMLEDVANQVSGISATRGFGGVGGVGGSPISQYGLAQALAPNLNQFRQQNISNLMGARQQDIGLRQQDLMALLELAGLAMPQTVAGQKGESSSFNLSFDPSKAKG